MEAAPGEYDLWMIYHPSDANPTLKGTKKIEGLVVPEVGGVRRRVDLETPLGMLRIAVVSGEEDWSDRVEIRVMRSGADPAAASPVLDEIGLGEHHMPVGTYDVYLNFEMTEGVNRSEVFKNVGLGNAYVWDQRFDATETEWVAQKVKVPAEPAVPIQAIAEPAGDDDSAGDDDDSAGDDESASGTESGASEGGDAAGAEAAEAAGAAEAAAPDAAPVVPAQPAEGRAELR